MPKRAHYFDRYGREVAEHEAMRNGTLRDHFSMRVPTVFRDSRFADARQLWDSGQLVVSDSDLTGSSGNRPGFRVSDSPINRQEIADARAQYLHDLQNAWRNPLRLGDAALPRDPEEDEDDEDEDDEDEQGELETATSDRRTVDQIAHDHQQRMSQLYSEHSQWLAGQYKSKG